MRGTEPWEAPDERSGRRRRLICEQAVDESAVAAIAYVEGPSAAMMSFSK